MSVTSQNVAVPTSAEHFERFETTGESVKSEPARIEYGALFCHRPCR